MGTMKKVSSKQQQDAALKEIESQVMLAFMRGHHTIAAISQSINRSLDETENAVMRLNTQSVIKNGKPMFTFEDGVGSAGKAKK